MTDKERWLRRAASLRRLRARMPLTSTEKAEMDDVIEAVESAAVADPPLHGDRLIALVERIALWELWRLLRDVLH